MLWEDLGWIAVGQDVVKWQDFMKKLMNIIIKYGGMRNC
jgi:hypothetical protein